MVNKQKTFDGFFEIVDSFMIEFFNIKDRSIDDNLRWAIAHKILARVFETCPLEYL